MELDSLNNLELLTAKPTPVYIYNPPPLVPPFLLTLNQSPKDIAGSDITNCLMHTYYSI